jgi:hypothetical protein
MFEIGKTSTIQELENSEAGYHQVTYYNQKVVSVEWPWVEFDGGERRNMNSPLFHSATDTEAQKKRQSDMATEFGGFSYTSKPADD